MNFIEAMKVAEGVFEQYRLHQLKWWRRMDGTPILNDIAVRMAVAFSEVSTPSPAAPTAPVTMDDAMAAGDGTLHGAIGHWQERALKAEAALKAQTAPTTVEDERTLGCGHSMSLAVTSAESGQFLYCELCDAKSGRRDAEQMEAELRKRAARLETALRDISAMTYDAWSNGARAGEIASAALPTAAVKAAEVPLSNDEALDQIQHVFEHDEWREQAWEHGILMETNDNELAARVKAHANRYVAELIAAAPAQGKAAE